MQQYELIGSIPVQTTTVGDTILILLHVDTQILQYHKNLCYDILNQPHWSTCLLSNSVFVIIVLNQNWLQY